MTAPEQARVRLRWARGTFITDPMPRAEAGKLQDDLLDEVAAKGDGCGFVDFPGLEGREVSVRARDVVAVEFLPELPDRRPAPFAAGGVHVAVSGGGQGEIGEAPGTAFLRQQAAGRVRLDAAGGRR